MKQLLYILFLCYCTYRFFFLIYVCLSAMFGQSIYFLLKVPYDNDEDDDSAHMISILMTKALFYVVSFQHL
jgi:hypothetical protein